MGNAQNETQQTGAAQNETPQSNATSNNGNSNPKRSWIRRHPILSIIICMIILIILVSIISSNNRSAEREQRVSACQGGDDVECQLACKLDLDLKACNMACQSGDSSACERACVYGGTDGENNKAFEIGCTRDKIEFCCLMFESMALANNDKTAEDSALQKLKEIKAEQNECNISKWQITMNSDLTYTLRNVSWQSNPIQLPADCVMVETYVNHIQNDIELGNEINQGIMQNISGSVLDCAKSSNNEKLRQVAKKCNGKWF